MAGSTVRELLLLLGVEVEKDAADKVSAVGEAFDEVKKAGLDLLGTLAAVGAGIAAAAGAFAAQAVSTAGSAKAIENQAASLGLTTDAYQELLYAAGRYGTEAGDLADVFGQISQLAVEAANGNQTYADTFARLGVSLDMLAGKNPDELFMLLADGLGKTTDATERLALASTILGEDSAKKLGPLLAKGAAGVTALRVEAHRLGIVMDEEAIASASMFSTQMGDLGATVTALRNEFGLALIPALSKLATRFLDWYRANQEVIGQKVDEYATKIGEAFTAVADALTRVDTIIGGAKGWEKLGTIIATLAGGTGVAYVAWKFGALGMALWNLGSAVLALVPGLSAVGGVLVEAAALGMGPFLGALGAIAGSLGSMALAAAPWIAAAAAILLAVAQLAAMIGGFLLTLEDFYTYLRGGDSVVGRFIERFREGNGTLAAFARYLEALGALASAVFGLMGREWDVFYAKIAPELKLLEVAWDMIGYAIQSVTDLVTTSLTAAFNALAPLLDLGAGLLNGLATDINSTPGGVAGLTPYASASGSLAPGASSAFAPTTAGAGAPAAASTITQSVGGDTNTYYVTEMSDERLRAIMAEEQARKNRKTAAVFAGAAV